MSWGPCAGCLVFLAYRWEARPGSWSDDSSIQEYTTCQSLCSCNSIAVFVHFSFYCENLTGNTILQVIDHLELMCPGIGERLLDGDRLRSTITAVVDGVISQLSDNQAGLRFSSEDLFKLAVV